MITIVPQQGLAGLFVIDSDGTGVTQVTSMLTARRCPTRNTLRSHEDWEDWR
jgi:hypothetical protein